MLPLRRTLGLALAVALVGGCGNGNQTTPAASEAPSSVGTSSPPVASSAAPRPSVGPSPGTSRRVTGRFDPTGLKVSFDLVADGLDSPLAVVSANDGSGRLFVVEQGGRIRVVRDGAVVPEPFLDVADRISGGGEQGLLGLAFHPDFPTDPRFFVNYTNSEGDTRISAFTVDGSNPDRADPGSERQLLSVDQPYSNHNGGGLQFGPDGFLYVALGDGGSGGDPHGNGQKLSTALAKLLRVDVGAADARDVAAPADNPFANRSDAQPLVDHLGLRNPWRFSFDRATGDLWIGDVGQNTWEEIDVARAGTLGLDFGWNRMEGSHCFRPSTGCDRAGLTLPVAEYSHSDGCTVIGGYVYRGTAQPAVTGGYVFGDYCSGTIWAMDAAGDEEREATVVGALDGSLSSFGEDEAGELYATDISNGRLLRLAASR
ncbi:MAG: PQQ-dependent sugar dehydrogenase [Chloroflexota bacterium]